MKWFKHDTDANMDAKLQEVMLDYGLEGYGLYWYCIELVAQNVNGDNLTFELEHDARIIARNTGSTPQKVQEMMKKFIELGLLNASNGHVFCLKLAHRCDDFTAKAVRRKGIKSVINQQVGVSPTNSDKVPLEEEVRSKKIEVEKEVKTDSRFDEFWDIYAKKVDTKKCKAKFNKLSDDAKNKIFSVLPDYVASTPDKQYRKLPLTWLNGECWNDEIQKSFDMPIECTIDFELLVKNFNDAMANWEGVPEVIKVTDKQKEMISILERDFAMTDDRFKGYFNHIATSEKFRYFVDGANIPPQNLTFFLKEDTIQR